MKKELTSLEREIKEVKNSVSASFKKIKGVKNPSGLTNYLLENTMSVQLYGKSFEAIKHDIESSTSIKFDGNNIIEYMNGTNQRIILTALKQLKKYVQNKEGIDYFKVSGLIFDEAFYIAHDAHDYLKQLINETQRKESVYSNLKRTIIEQVAIEETEKEQEEYNDFYSEQKEFFKEEETWEKGTNHR